MRPAAKRQGIGGGIRGGARRLAALLPIVLAAAGCDVRWGGARVALEDPAPEPAPAEVVEAGEEERATPLPEGPFLYAARPVGPGTARVTPVAALPAAGGPPAAIDLPEPLPPEFRARFDSVFLRPGTELVLQHRGQRIGSLVLAGTRPPDDPGCPSVAEGSLLLVPGQRVPPTAMALAPELSPSLPEPVPAVEPVRGMTIAAPVIAERLIAGERAYLARRVSLQAVALADDTAPAMAATYLIEDSLAVGPPTGDAVSLFFLSAPDPARGYVTRWSELRRYDTAEEKEAFEYLDWARMPAGRLHLLRLYGGSALRLAADFVPEGREGEEGAVEWREEGRCPALARLESG